LGEQLAGETLAPRERILSVFAELDRFSESGDFRGCPFVGAATELKDRDHPATQIAREQKAALTEYFASALRAGGASHPDQLAPQLTLLFDGASAHAMMHGKPTPAARQAVEALLGIQGM
jgi:hypothetical protein